jgi:hypothetical protein
MLTVIVSGNSDLISRGSDQGITDGMHGLTKAARD